MTDDEREIRGLVDSWMEASRRGDIETVLRLMNDDVLFMTPGREPFGKAEFQAASEAMRGVKMDGRAEVRELRVLGQWAWIRNHIDLTVTPPDGEPMHRSGYTLSILEKGSEGRWRLARDANLVI
ncbi:MAG: YybH family protein [Sphingomicrobium sp.]